MNKKNLILDVTVFILMFYHSNAQKGGICNQFTDWNEKYKKLIPKDFCMPEGYRCYYFINNVDLTADGKNDLVIHWEKKKQVDGDTTFVSIYQKINDTTFVHKATLANLYALYFKEYELMYNPPKLLENAFLKLATVAPYFKLEFRKNLIWVELFTEAQAGVNLFFSYNIQKKNWFLSKEVYWFGDNLRVAREIRETKILKNGISIQEFNMFDYLYD
jgi:hypothetical protein